MCAEGQHTPRSCRPSATCKRLIELIEIAIENLLSTAYTRAADMIASECYSNMQENIILRKFRQSLNWRTNIHMSVKRPMWETLVTFMVEYSKQVHVQYPWNICNIGSEMVHRHWDMIRRSYGGRGWQLLV